MSTVFFTFIAVFFILTFLESSYLIIKKWIQEGFLDAVSVIGFLVTLVVLAPLSGFILFLSVSILPFFGILLIINGLIMLKKESISLANSLSLLLGIQLFSSKFCFYSYTFNSKILRTLANFYLGYNYLLIWMLIIFSFYVFWIGRSSKKLSISTIIILGCGLVNNKVTTLLRGRLDKAIELHRQAPKSKIIVSGGQGSDETRSEASAMREYLIEHGIEPKTVVLENKSRNTYENMLFSKLKSKSDIHHTVFVTSNYHVLRANFFSKEVGVAKKGIGGKVALYFLPSAFIREFIACMLIGSRLVYSYLFINEKK